MSKLPAFSASLFHDEHGKAMDLLKVFDVLNSTAAHHAGAVKGAVNSSDRFIALGNFVLAQVGALLLTKMVPELADMVRDLPPLDDGTGKPALPLGITGRPLSPDIGTVASMPAMAPAAPVVIPSDVLQAALREQLSAMGLTIPTEAEQAALREQRERERAAKEASAQAALREQLSAMGLTIPTEAEQAALREQRERERAAKEASAADTLKAGNLNVTDVDKIDQNAAPRSINFGGNPA